MKKNSFLLFIFLLELYAQAITVRNVTQRPISVSWDRQLDRVMVEPGQRTTVSDASSASIAIIGDSEKYYKFNDLTEDTKIRFNYSDSKIDNGGVFSGVQYYADGVESFGKQVGQAGARVDQNQAELAEVKSWSEGLDNRLAQVNSPIAAAASSAERRKRSSSIKSKLRKSRIARSAD